MEAVVTTRESPRFWASVRESIRGTHQDFTSGSIDRAILLLAVPMVLEMVMESLFAVVDVFWVAHLGSDAVATVGLTESMLILVGAVSMGLALSTTAMVARRIGEKDPDGAAVAAVQAIAIGLAVAAVVGALGVLRGPALLRLMGATPSLVNVGSAYARITLGGAATVVLLYLNNAIFRGAGDATVAMRVLWLANLINLALDPCLIFGLGPFPRLGVEGAAVATTFGRGIGVVVQFVVLARGTERIRVRTEQIRIHLGVLGRLVDGGVADNLGIVTLVETYINQVTLAQQEHLADPYPNGAVFIVVDSRVNFAGDIQNEGDLSWLDILRNAFRLTSNSLLNRVSTATMSDLIVRNAPDNATARELRDDIEKLENEGFLEMHDRTGHKVTVVYISLSQVALLREIPFESFRQTINSISTYFNISAVEAYDLYEAADLLVKEKLETHLRDVAQQLYPQSATRPARSPTTREAP